MEQKNEMETFKGDKRGVIRGWKLVWVAKDLVAQLANKLSKNFHV
jgi:hypothetical protein